METGAQPDRVESAPRESSVLMQRLRVWTPRALGVGALASLFLHLTLMVLAGVIGFGDAQAGGAGPLDSPVQMAIATDAQLAEIERAAMAVEAPPAPTVPTPEMPALELSQAASSDPASSLLEISAMDAQTGAGDIGGGELGVGGSGGGGGAASFFGVEARGTRFAYIVDVSGSMAINDKIVLLRRELAKSINALFENAQFLVVLYQSNAIPLGGRDEWTDGTPAGRRWAEAALKSVSAGGGTNPLPAFQMVLQKRPRPDAIYFMTDGEFNAAIAVEIMRLNSEVRVPIHCITFVNREAEEMMRRIATHSGGSYHHVAGPLP